MPSEPGAETVESREQHPFGDVALVELVPDLPFELAGNDHPAIEIFLIEKPVIDGLLGIRHH